MITHVRTAEKELVPLADDPDAVGDEFRAWRTFHLSRDGSYEVGLIDFQGEAFDPPQDGYEDTLVILQGTAEVEADGTTYSLHAGDVIVYESPFSAKRIRSPEGFRAAWVVRHRDPERIQERLRREDYLDTYGAA